LNSHKDFKINWRNILKKEIDKDKYLKKIKMAKRGSIKRPPIKIEKSVSENESD